MKHGDYKLPSGRDLSTITFEDIRWQYRVFHCNSTGAGRDKKYFPWRGAKTKLGEIEEHDWCQLAEAIIERAGETDLLKQLIQWCTEHNFTGDSAAEIRKEALQLHTSRIFDNPQWVGYLPFNKRYRPEIWDAANIVFVRMECCSEPGAVTQEQINRSYMGQIACPHCGRWNTFTILGNRSGSSPISGPIPHSNYEPDAKCLISGKDADADDTDSPWEEDDDD